MRKAENFPKQSRLLSQADFTRIRSKAKVFRSNNFNVYYKRNEGKPKLARLGISVPAKCGKAVVRNRIKRIIRDIFRKVRIEIDAFDFVIAIHFSPSVLENLGPKIVEKEIREDLEKFFKIVKGQK